MQSLAVILEQPRELGLRAVELTAPGDDDVIVDVRWSGISTGTERLLWSGRMPPFPGMGYPLIPGYEAAGLVVGAGSAARQRIGDHVFVPGANCYGAVRGLFGASSSRLVTRQARAVAVDHTLGDRAVLLALAATAHHALAARGAELPDLIVGHGIVGRLLARLAIALGGEPPTVWEREPCRASGAQGYPVLLPSADNRRDYGAIYDASGSAGILDELIGRTAKGGEIVLAGFYDTRLDFNFVPAFMREIRIRVAAEWLPDDLDAVNRLAGSGMLSLDGLISHAMDARDATHAYTAAFEDVSCLKMVLDWRTCT
ncbi:MAG: chlorophyll synthesis pathway protein BchC [Hyphomicrobium sp.]